MTAAVFSLEEQVTQAHHPVIAAIDLGTNSCRLLVASVNVASLNKSFFNAKPSLVGWKVIDSFARIVRLGEGLQQHEILSTYAIDRTIEALAVCRGKMDFHAVARYRAVATEACRRAINSQDLLDEVYQTLKIPLEIVSSEEEARLAITGCSGLLEPKVPYAVLFDIGGGSTEIVWLKLQAKTKRRPGYPVPFKILDSMSIPFGVVVCSERLEKADQTIEVAHKIRSQVREHVQAFLEHNEIAKHFHQTQLIGSSGTVTTLAAVQMRLKRYERRLVDGVILRVKDFHKASQSILNMDEDDRFEHPCIGRGRSDLIVIGSAILEGILDVLPLPDIRVADRGVREGILSELLVNLNKPFGQELEPLEE